MTDFIVRKSVIEKTVILLKRFFLPRGYLSRVYKVDSATWRIYLYYPVHWLSLFKRHIPTVWNEWKGETQVATPVQRENALRQWLAKARC